MDNMKILKRAWYIIWDYRTLWIFGFILALTIGGATSRIGSNSGYRYNNNQNIQNNINVPSWAEEPFRSPQAFMEALRSIGQAVSDTIKSQPEIRTFFSFVVVFLIVMVFYGIVMKMLGYVSETAVIRMVDEFESTSKKMTIREGFRQGWTLTSWRLFLIDLLTVSLPSLVFITILGLLIWGGVSLGINMGTTQGWVFSAFLMVGLIFLTVSLFSIYFISISLLRNFFVRSCALEQVGVGAAIQNGYALVRANWKEVGLFWLILIGLGIAWSILSILLLILLIPFFVVSFILAAVIASVPGLLMGGFSSIFLTGYWPIVVGVLFGLPLFIPLAGSPIFFFEGLMQLFKSASWTLVYREVKSFKPALIASEGTNLLEITS